jgi:peroxiredoxin Q/BCP
LGASGRGAAGPGYHHGEKVNAEALVRSTFLIDEKGKLIKIFPKVKPENHGREIPELL